jgi:carboxymethylenebutenolidase
MCYNPNDLPPNPPGNPGQATGQDIVLTSADGTRFAAYAAHPAAPSTAAIVIYPDVRGLHNFYKELALRFAEQSIDAVAIDYFGRTAGLTPRDDSFDYMPHVQQIQYPSFLSDVQAALSYLHDHATRAAQPSAPPPQSSVLTPQSSISIFTVGFCMGGSLSLMTAAENLPLSGAIAFYSGFGRKFTLPDGTQLSALDRSPNIRVPVLGLYGGADQSIPPDQIDQLDRNLTTAGVDHEIVVYPGAPHSFFDRKFTEFAKESADSWTRVLNFISAHSK